MANPLSIRKNTASEKLHQTWLSVRNLRDRLVATLTAELVGITWPALAPLRVGPTPPWSPLFAKGAHHC